MKEMYGGEIEGDILNCCYKYKTYGDMVNYRNINGITMKTMMIKKIMKNMTAKLKVVRMNIEVGRTN